MISQKIILNNIKANIHIGVTDAEKRKKQKLLLTIEMVPQIELPLKSDNVEETVNYSDVRSATLNILKDKRYNLLETLCWDIAKYIKDNFRVKEVTVVAKKFPYRDVKYVSYIVTLR